VNDLLSLLVLSWAAVFFFMLTLWLIQLITRNAAILDVGWASALAGLVLFAAFSGGGWEPRKWLFAAMVSVWGGRLALYLLKTRVWKGHAEDPRYTDLKKKWGKNAGWMLLLTFQFQGALDVVLAVPFFLICGNKAPVLSSWEWVGLAVWAAAFIGETLADMQLNAFKADPANRGKTCRSGLWNYSRHPNYFFEWLVWCGYALYALASPWGFTAIGCPLLIFYFLFKVTGIPLTEAQAVKTKGRDYREYQRTTSVFVPWFHKTGKGAS
jgi:steroid 5-alpha reductase family enzyme